MTNWSLPFITIYVKEFGIFNVDTFIINVIWLAVLPKASFIRSIRKDLCHETLIVERLTTLLYKFSWKPNLCKKSKFIFFMRWINSIYNWPCNFCLYWSRSCLKGSMFSKWAFKPWHICLASSCFLCPLCSDQNARQPKVFTNSNLSVGSTSELIKQSQIHYLY